MSARTFLAFMGVLAVVGLLTFGLISKGGNSVDIGQPFPDRTLDALRRAGDAYLATVA